MPNRNWLDRFLPKSQSKTVFIFTMTCYTFTLHYIVARLIWLFGFSPTSNRSITSTPIVPLLIAPVVESFVVIGLIELVRRLKFKLAVQIAVPVLVSCFLESPLQPFWGIRSAPLFFIGAASYIYWRGVSFWTAAQIVILLHFFYNALVFLNVTARWLHPAS